MNIDSNCLSKIDMNRHNTQIFTDWYFKNMIVNIQPQIVTRLHSSTLPPFALKYLLRLEKRVLYLQMNALTELARIIFSGV